MLYEPIQYVVTGKRICDEDICETLEKIGKEEALYRMWKGSMPYLQSIANKVCAPCAHHSWVSRFRLGGVALRFRFPRLVISRPAGTERHRCRCPRQPAKALEDDDDDARCNFPGSSRLGPFASSLTTTFPPPPHSSLVVSIACSVTQLTPTNTTRANPSNNTLPFSTFFPFLSTKEKKKSLLILQQLKTTF